MCTLQYNENVEEDADYGNRKNKGLKLSLFPLSHLLFSSSWIVAAN